MFLQSLSSDFELMHPFHARLEVVKLLKIDCPSSKAHLKGDGQLQALSKAAGS